ncbi:MAG TPA: serine/threonine-protein kinase [Candidatus Polarisedimenticolia bacterium]|nr:serine/threonine-protein kinase [Candidatus Polarisedimenticolia bacterium]
MNLTRLGRFEILREIGKGAMGQVFLANDPKIQRQVAIKTIVLPPGTSAEEAHETSQRFLREAQAAGKLLHPNIVTIFDVGEEGGVSFIAMEFIEGETLEKFTRPDSLLPLARVQDLIAQAAAALDYAHQNHVIHRDIKPANLMVLKGGVLKVTDFGLAKNPSANLTQAGVLLGTPSYMSPEQIQGRDLDGRSDLFSLGVVLYELLTGVRPFAGDSISTIIYRVLYEDPRPPAAHNPALPPEVNAILERLLAKDPEERYALGADLVADLGKAFAGLPPGTLSGPFPGIARAAGQAGEPRPGTTRRAGGRDDRAPRQGRRRGHAEALEARRPGARDGMPVTAQGPARPTLMAHHPGKIAAVLLTAVLCLVIFPRWANRHEPAASAGRGGVASSPGPGNLSSAALGGSAPAPPEATAGGAAGGGVVAGQVSIEVETIPHGGAVSLDRTPLAEPRVVLSLSDPHPHDIVAQAGCRQAVAEMTAADLASYKGSLVLELRPRREDVMLVSEPPGARIVLNGKDSGKVTPAVVTLDGCEERTIALQHDGYRAWSRHFDSDDDFDAMVQALKKIPLEPIPSGTMLIKKPKEYDVDIYAGDRLLGKAGQSIGLTEGKYALTLRNDKLFVRETLQVQVPGGREVSPLVNLPLLGTLTVQAQPSNCKVYVDGVYVDATPIFELPIASGGHRVKVVFVPNGAAQEVNTSIAGGKNSLVTVKF